MSRPSARLFLGFLLAILAAEAWLLLGKSSLLIDQHEGDALHLMQIARRMADGQMPHLDFMTPIGILAFAPISWLMSLGVSAGHAMMGAMVLDAALMLPAIWWVGYSRLGTGLAYGFGAFVLILTTALVYGGSDQVASISMYYNRWAWAVTFLLVVMAVLPAKRPSQTIDGVYFGLGLAFLALSKITFFVAFLPGIILALVLRRQLLALGMGTLAGLVVAAIVTLFAGVDFWLAYVGDLRAISGSGIRPNPGESLSFLLVSPVFLAGNICLLAAVILLRQGGKGIEGAVLAVFAPAFIYVTYQNWGNDPKWLLLLAVMLLSSRPDRHINNAFGWDVGRTMSIVALVSTVLYLPSIYTLSTANLRHARMGSDGFFQVFPGRGYDDVMMRVDRMYANVQRAPVPFPGAEMRAVAEAEIQHPSDALMGQPLELCKLHMGLVGMLHQMAKELDELPETAGKSVFVADTFSNLWLFGETMPVPGAAPWYYGLKQAYKDADYLLIPLCPVTPAARSQVLSELPTSGVSFKEVTRNELFILLRVLPN